MDERLEMLYNLLQQKSRRVYGFFKQNAPENAFEVFRQARPTSKYTQFKIVGRGDDIYIVLRTKKTGYRESEKEYFDYHAVFIVGIDDTERFFCHRLPWRNDFEYDDFLETITYERILRFLGIDSHIYDVNGQLEFGKTYRVQGDITIRLMKIDFAWLREKIRQELLENKQRNLKHAILKFLERCILRQDTYPYSSFFDIEQVVRKIPRLRKHEKIKNIFRTITITLPEKFRRIILQNVIEIREEFMGRGRTILGLLNVCAQKITSEMDIVVTDGEIRREIKKLAELESRYTIRIGSHYVKTIGVVLSDINTPGKYRSKAIYNILWWELARPSPSWVIILLRPQEIAFLHSEHKSTFVKVDFEEQEEIVIAVLGILETHRMQVRRR
ncbi:MAG: hypothetical protein Q6363_004275 [Candidatus Njordarchaeota archaeon]